MRTDKPADRIEELRRRLDELHDQEAKVAAEIEWIQSRGQMQLPGTARASTPPAPETPADKIALFLDLFGTRRSVFPRRWENGKTGRSGYSPACNNEWRPGICHKPQVKCAECPHQKFPALDSHAMEMHLRGLDTLGVYAIDENGGCRFLAADFDGDGWRENVAAYRAASAKAGVSISVERSRSGNGAHVWIFFSDPVPAVLARRLGALLLAKAGAMQPSMGLEAFDRFFPNQDALPSGGFGNLIALPLAKEPRQAGNTLFVDEAFDPMPDQWAYLASLRRLSLQEVLEIVSRLSPLSLLDQAASRETPDLVLQSEETTLDLSRPMILRGMLSGELTVTLDSRLHIPRTIPIPVLAALKRLASFANPVFHEKLRLRFATFDTPRFLFAGECRTDRLVLPRGVLEPAIQILEDAGAAVVVSDQRAGGKRCVWTFNGQLRPEQQYAVREMERHDIGVLCAPPGAGKTVMGCALIARHRTSTLVLVHRSLLLEQWKEAAVNFLGLKKKEVGVWRGAKPRLTHRLDIAMLPSLARAVDYTAAFAGYGLIVIDECHHVPAATFELLMKACPVRRIIGLTATPKRKDRLEKLMHLQCGPTRHTLTQVEQTEPDRVALVRQTSITLPPGPNQLGIHEVWDALVADEGRLQRIVSDIGRCTVEGRSPLILADRKVYLDRIEDALKQNPSTQDIARYRLESGVGKKARKEIRARIDAHYVNGERFVLLATASLVGEGFDLPQLDTLVLAMPLSFKGRLIQYAGRIHRTHEGKASARIYDYLDENSPLTKAMFSRRPVGYRQMGYRIEFEGEGCALLKGSGESALSRSFQ